MALIVETDPEGKLQPCVYVRRNGRVTEHLLPPAFLHDFRTPEHRAELESLLAGLGRPQGRLSNASSRCGGIATSCCC